MCFGNMWFLKMLIREVLVVVLGVDVLGGITFCGGFRVRVVERGLDVVGSWGCYGSFVIWVIVGCGVFSL